MSSCLEHHLEFDALVQFNKYFLGAFFAGTVPGAGDLAVNQADMVYRACLLKGSQSNHYNEVLGNRKCMVEGPNLSFSFL